MATRFYFPLNDDTSGVTPDFYSLFGYTSEAVRRDLVTVKGTETLTVGTRVGPWTSGQYALDRQYISAPLAAQTWVLGGVPSYICKTQLMVREYANTDNVGFLRVTARVWDGVSFTLVANSDNSYAEFINNATHRNQGNTETATSGSDITVHAGSRLVVDIGYSDQTGSTPEASAKWGNTALTDLPENNTQTTNGNPWIEFWWDITFQTAGAAQLWQPKQAFVHLIRR